MKLTGPACTEAMNEAEEVRRRERTEDNAGGVRVERRVRAMITTCPIYEPGIKPQ
jgi:metal-sulfur cluster biosynthetic enzyme